MANVRRITLDADVQALARDLNSGKRARPAVVVSVPGDRKSTWIDPDRIAQELDDLADVYLLADLSMSWAFTSVMPNGTSVYGGAGRVYPPDLAWVHDPLASRLQLAYTQAEGGSATTALIEAALDAAAVCGLVGKAPPPDRARQVTAVVLGCPTESQALVNTGDGFATIRVGTLLPRVASERLFQQGMEVTGVLDTVSRILDVGGSLPDPASRVLEIEDGQCSWARVDKIRADKAQLCLYPGILVAVTAFEVIGDAEGDLRDLLTLGETVAVRVRHRAEGIGLELTGFDTPAADITSLSFLPGGPPWLIAPAPPVAAPEEPPTGEIPKPVVAEQVPAPADPPTTSYIPKPSQLFQNMRRSVKPKSVHQLEAEQLAPQLDASRQALSNLDQELNRVSAQLISARRQIESQERDLAAARSDSAKSEKQLARLRRELRDARRSSQAAEKFLFLDPDEQFRYGVYSRWVQRIPAAEKPERALAEYRLGPVFIASLEALEGIAASKVHDVVVEVLTGIADSMPGRDIHPLRKGLGGDDPVVRREDGATCWRVALQKNTPSARRMHFWRHADYIELSRVVLHDDCQP